MNNPHRQVGLRRESTKMVVNLPDVGLRPGWQVTLIGEGVDDEAWTVEWVSPRTCEKASLKTYWHNNV